MSDLRNQLRDLRAAVAESEGVELYRVFQNVTIEEICEKQPKSSEELLLVKGMGEKKVKKYGERILRLVNQESGIMNHGLESGFPASAQSGGLVETGLSAVALAEEGMTSRGEELESDKQLVSVSEYIEYLNLVLQKTADVKIIGEVSASKMYPSGFYFTLKDKYDESALSCYLPTYTYRGLGIPIEDGMEVSVEGMPRLVKRNGRFQFTVESVQLVGEGALKKAYELLKAKLEEEGLFARKRELPEFITSVGVITSRAGAVIHDFRNNLAKLGIKVYLKDVRVEGASSPGMIIKAIKYFNDNLSHSNKRSRDAVVAAEQVDGQISNSSSFAKATEDRQFPISNVDVIIVMRGGGSMEDLQGFNNEAVVRAVFGSKIPTIVSIGHDKDVPLAQLAADVMVSTPTAAAHAVSATWNRLLEDVPQLQNDLLYSANNVLQQARSRFALNVQSVLSWCSRLSQSYKGIRDSLVGQVERYVGWVQEQQKAVMGQIGQIRHMQSVSYRQVAARMEAAATVLEQANPERQLRLGYSIVKNKQGKVVRSVKEVVKGDELRTQVADGTIGSTVN